MLFSDEIQFYVDGEVNKQSRTYDSETGDGATSWCGIWSTGIVVSVFIPGNLTGERYGDVFPSLLNPEDDFSIFPQQDGALLHHLEEVRHSYLWGRPKDRVYRETVNQHHVRRWIQNTCAAVKPDVFYKVRGTKKRNCFVSDKMAAILSTCYKTPNPKFQDPYLLNK